MKKRPLFTWIDQFYPGGFRKMRSGRMLWGLILVKLIKVFFIVKLFFFPGFTEETENKEEKKPYVSDQPIQQTLTP